MCLGSIGETELAAVLSQPTNKAVLGFVPVSHMVSKLSEETLNLKYHIPKSSCSSKFFCLHILVQNWNLFLENTQGGKQPCLGKLGGYFLLAEASYSLEQCQHLKGKTFSYFLGIP